MNVLVSGGSRGIGLQISRKCIESGYNVFGLIYSSSEILLKTAVLSRNPTTPTDSVNINSPPEQIVRAYMCDIRDEEQIIQTVSKIYKEHKNIDHLINCAGECSI
jgi:NAD(P)-dependent dehydrogenase (short-subunit alcohol dehydrogenase family)